VNHLRKSAQICGFLSDLLPPAFLKILSSCQNFIAHEITAFRGFNFRLQNSFTGCAWIGMLSGSHGIDWNWFGWIWHRWQRGF
jgi:hypothetical protein